MSEKEQSILQKIVLESIKEQRLQRRWGIFFKLTFLILGLAVLCFTLWNADGKHNVNKLGNKAHTALIDIDGPIMSGADVDADSVAASLRLAFADKGTKGIVLRINSPGGSPVQANYIYEEINRLKQLHPTIKVYAVCEDICASGAYYVATAADTIYADPASLIGSIGVVMNGFGFVDAMQQWGVSRRLFTAGAHKGFLDPFSPLKPAEIAHVQRLLNEIHQQFINKVKQGRGARLHINQDTFSGLIWTGIQAKEMGLIDGFGSTGYVARELIKADAIVDYTVRPNYLQRLAGRIGTSASDRLVKNLGLEQGLALI